MFAEKDEKYIDYIIWISMVILVNVLSTDSQLENNQGTSICYVTEIYRKTNISYFCDTYTTIQTLLFAYQRVKGVSFSKNLAYILRGWTSTWQSKTNILRGWTSTWQSKTNLVYKYFLQVNNKDNRAILLYLISGSLLVTLRMYLLIGKMLEQWR